MLDIDATHASLRKLLEKPDVDAIEDVCEAIDQSEDGRRFVPDLLSILEENSDFDFGTPGPIVHTVERYFRQGYEQCLVASL